MNREEIWEQYDRFLKHAQIELDKVYWIFNFFFLANSAFLGIFLTKNVQDEKIFPVFGIFLSLLWYFSFHKQVEWLGWWINKVKALQAAEYLNITDDNLKMFADFTRDPLLHKLTFSKTGIWFTLRFLPIAFLVAWVYLFVV